MKRNCLPKRISHSHNFGITPFGVICLDCYSPVGKCNDYTNLMHSIRMHNKREGHRYKDGDTAVSIANELKIAMARRYRHVKDYSPWIKKKNIKSWVCACGETFTKVRNVKRHIKRAANNDPEGIHESMESSSVLTVCERVINVQKIKGMMHDPFCSIGLVSRDVTVLDCFQFEHNDINAPVLPPDVQLCAQKGKGNPIYYHVASEAREAYKLGMLARSSKFKKRKFLAGSSYQSIIWENAKKIDVQKFGGKLDLNIRMKDGSITILKVRDLSSEVEALTEIKKFNDRCNKQSIVRGGSQDNGQMYAFGRFRKDKNYVSMTQNDEMNIRQYIEVSKLLLEKYFKNELQEIRDADRAQGVVPLESMCGENGISSYCLVSKDLVNAAHYDLDTSVGISVFNEKIPGTAKDWYFILPNTVLADGNKQEAIIIRLFDACTLSWDGRVVFHCTGTLEVGKGNHLYGNYWGGKKYN